MEEKLLTVSECAKRLDLSADSIRRFERNGILPAAIRVGKGQRLFAEDNVERLAADRERKRIEAAA
jgi:excisionase family DNA binding protein